LRKAWACEPAAGSAGACAPLRSQGVGLAPGLEFAQDGFDGLARVGQEVLVPRGVLSEITGERVTYQDTPVEEYAAGRIQAGMPEPWAWFIAAWFQAAASGAFTPTSDIEQLTGRPSTSLRESSDSGDPASDVQPTADPSTRAGRSSTPPSAVPGQCRPAD
jgi:hypothetical protein